MYIILFMKQILFYLFILFYIILYRNTSDVGMRPEDDTISTWELMQSKNSSDKKCVSIII